MVKVKICGITNSDDAVSACAYGADLIGFVFIEGTPRGVDKLNVKNIIKDIDVNSSRSGVKVGLFKDENKEKVSDIAVYCGLDCVQLQGEESPEYCRELKAMVKDERGRDIEIIKAFKVKDEILSHGMYVPADYLDADYFVFDTFNPDISGGTGEIFDWEVLKREVVSLKKPFFVAGGLNPGNVQDAIKVMLPYGVDVSSGIERKKGMKDVELLKEFIQNAKIT